jgi:hypothetical protein
MISPVHVEGLSSRAEVLFWIGRELVWWWLGVGLVAIARLNEVPNRTR